MQCDLDKGNLEYKMTEEEIVNYMFIRDIDTSEYLLDENTYNVTYGVFLESTMMG